MNLNHHPFTLLSIHSLFKHPPHQCAVHWRAATKLHAFCKILIVNVNFILLLWMCNVLMSCTDAELYGMKPCGWRMWKWSLRHAPVASRGFKNNIFALINWSGGNERDGFKLALMSSGSRFRMNIFHNEVKCFLIRCRSTSMRCASRSSSTVSWTGMDVKRKKEWSWTTERFGGIAGTLSPRWHRPAEDWT